MDQKFDNRNSGVLWTNDTSENPKRPQLTGTIELGQDILHDLSNKFKEQAPLVIRIAAWKKEKADGSPYLKLSLSKSEPRGSEREAEAKPAPAPAPIPGDEMPF